MKSNIIIGGGIGGLALANSFRHFGIDYQLFESAQELGEVGAGIGISESTIEILSALGLSQELKQKGRYVQDAIIVNKEGHVVRKLPVKNGGSCIHRMELINLLKKNLDTTKIHLNHKLRNLEDEDGVSILTFENKKSIQADFIFCCDGINSLLRKKIYPYIQKRYSGQTVWRGISKVTLSEKFQNAYLEFWGDNLRFATIPIDDGAYYWYAVEEAKEGGKDNSEKIHTYLIELFKNFHQEIASVIANTVNIVRNDMFDLKPHSYPWYTKNLIFLGDSIHATTPNLAQGGCQAIEDAFTLAKLIHANGLKESAFKKFQALREEKVFFIVNQSWKYGKLTHQKNKIMEWATQQLFKVLPGSIFQSQYQKLIDINYLKQI